MATRHHELVIGNLKRQLPILNLNDNLAIAGFVILGDVELTSTCASELIKKIPTDIDIIMTAETKGIPLAAEMARQLGMTYYVTARKSIKAYMEAPIWVDDESITTLGKQRLYLMASDIEKLTGKRVLILDDVISTGGSLDALIKLATQAGGIIAAKAAILAEGNAIGRTDIIYLEELPLYKPE